MYVRNYCTRGEKIILATYFGLFFTGFIASLIF